MQDWSRLKKCLSLLSLILIAGLTACFAPPTPEITPTESSRTIVESNIDLRETWRISPVLIGSDNRQIAYIRLAPGRIVMQDAHFGYRGSRLASFSTSTGMLEWEVAYGKALHSIAVDEYRLYVALAGSPLEAYDIQNGELVWSSVELPERRLYFLDLRDDVLFNYSRGLIQTINPETGELLAEEHLEVPSVSLPIMRIDGFELHQTTGELFKLNLETGEVVWRTSTEKVSGFPLRFPILSGNRLIITYGWIDYDLYAVDFITGEPLWAATDFFVSNGAVAQGKVYVLREDARLVILDEMTGTELGYIQFSGPKTNPAEEIYWVGANDEGQVFVYFFDSQEIVALDINAQ